MATGSEINIQIGDIISKNNQPTFSYQDTTWRAIKFFKENESDTFNYSGFNFLTDKQFDESLLYQEEIYKSGTILFTMSHWLEKFMKETTPFNVQYAGAGINIIPEKQDITRDKKTILFVGRDFYRKGGDLVVDAFKKLHCTDPEIKLFIAGPQYIPSNFKGDGIYIFNDVSSKKITKLMKQASVFVMPSRFEAFGISFIEAMASGMPIIGRNKFEMPYFVDQGSGLILNSDSSRNNEIDDLAAKINTILTDQHYLEKAEKKAKYITDEYSWKNVAIRMTNKTM
ncbi:glycosyltransferase family 4 protein [Loigolactobacillus binensis]|uniref:Glycosyltransferase family 4 protein n=1 Tax=Loigolactobacillus binensis TaxID=2559922 RepID=A0ABW3EDL8_9LACO|nr:glycosyltransferase family 4 protein [Loigolactobacillus binensis]